MNTAESVVVGAIVLGSVLFLLVRLAAAAKGKRGTCRSCGDTCSCAIKEAMSRQD